MRATEVRAIDARLVPCAVVCWGVTLIGIIVGGRAAGLVATGMIVITSGVVVVTIMRSKGFHPPVLAFLAILVVGAGYGTAIAVRAHAVAVHPLAARAVAGGWVTATIAPVDDPKPLRVPGPAGERKVLVRARLLALNSGPESTRIGGSVLVFAGADEWAQLLPGQEVVLRGRLSPPPRRDLTVAVIGAAGPPLQVGPPSTVQRWAGLARSRFAAAAARALPRDQAGLLPGLVVGDTSALPVEVKDAFTSAGLAHLTAVSGANVSIVLGAVLLLVRGVGAGPRAGAVLAGLALVAFVIVARPSPSVLRAAAMGSIALLALVTGRRKQALPALAAAIVVLLAVFPALAVDPGFALSVAATVGLVLVAPMWTEWLRERGWPRPAAEVCAVAAAAHLVTAPLIAGVSGAVSMVSIAANILVAPVVAPVTVIGAVTAVLAIVWMPLAELVVRLSAPPLWWLLEVGGRAADVPSASLAVPGGWAGAVLVTGVVLLGVVVLRMGRVRRIALAVLIGVGAVWIPMRVQQPGWPVTGWSVVACDVGQGDALVLDTGDGRAVLVDVGPEARLMDGCLDRLGVTVIALVIVTHLHADHVGGLRGALDGRSVGAVATGPMRLPESEFRALVDTVDEFGVRLVELSAGYEMRIGALSLRVLAPLLPAPRDPADGAAAANDQSLVVMADTTVGRVLLTGDAESASQESMLRAGTELAADVLKMPHHGSRTTSPAFLAAVRPRLVLISVGTGNTFGHPNPEIVDTLERLGSVIVRTDLGGDIAVRRTGSGALSFVSRSHGTIAR